MLEQPQFDINEASLGSQLMETLLLGAVATGNRVSESTAMSRGATTFFSDDSEVVIPVKPGILYKNRTLYKTPSSIVSQALRNNDNIPHRLPGCCPQTVVEAVIPLGL